MPATPGTSPSNAVLLNVLADSVAGHYRDFVSAATAQGLTPSQAKALNVLRRGPATMRSLATSLHCDASNVTGIIDRLESRDLVCREPSPTDRRVKNVALTEQGAAAMDAVRAGMHATHEALNALDDGERATLEKLLSRLYPALGRASESTG